MTALSAPRSVLSRSAPATVLAVPLLHAVLSPVRTAGVLSLPRLRSLVTRSAIIGSTSSSGGSSVTEVYATASPPVIAYAAINFLPLSASLSILQVNE